MRRTFALYRLLGGDSPLCRVTAIGVAMATFIAALVVSTGVARRWRARTLTRPG